MPIRMSGLASGMDTESIVKELMSAQRMKSTKIEKSITKTEWKQEKWKDLNSKIYSFYTGSLSKMKMQGNFGKKAATSSDESKVKVESGGSAPEGNHSIKVKAVASSQFVTGAKLDTDLAVTTDTKLSDLGMGSADGSTISISAGKKAVAFNITSGSTVGDFVNTLKDAGLNASYDTTQKRFFISSKGSGYENAFSIEASSSNVDLTKLGLSEVTKTTNEDGTVDVSAGTNVSLVKPSDATIIYNGAELKSASNTISVNGLSVTVKGVTNFGATDSDTDDEVVNINLTNDTSTVYDMVKDFVKSYNEILKTMNEAYNADTIKGFEPLTADEKKGMSEEQIKKWEDKIKASLLRRDGTLSTISSTMRTALSKSVSVEGKSYSLASFGIEAVNYREKGLLHINGDPEDPLTSMEADSLKKALSEDPDAVMEVMTTLAKDLYSEMTEQMKSTSLRSALTLYNDKEIKSTIKTYKSDLSKMEDKLADMETRYYRQFTAMETAMSKLNSQSSSLLSMLGQNTSS